MRECRNANTDPEPFPIRDPRRTGARFMIPRFVLWRLGDSRSRLPFPIPDTCAQMLFPSGSTSTALSDPHLRPFGSGPKLRTVS
jgi:hypothetical protein